MPLEKPYEAPRIRIDDLARDVASNRLCLKTLRREIRLRMRNIDLKCETEKRGFHYDLVEARVLSSIVIEKMTDQALERKSTHPFSQSRYGLGYLNQSGELIPCSSDDNDIFSSQRLYSSSDPFFNFSRILDTQLDYALHCVINNPGSLSSIVDRMNVLVARMSKSALRGGSSKADEFISRGIHTATSAIASLLKVIPCVLTMSKRGIDPDLCLRFAMSSFAFIIRMAMLPFSQFASAMLRIEYGDGHQRPAEYIPERFGIINKGGKPYRVDTKVIGFPGDDLYQTGCPAHVVFDPTKGSAIQRLWKWALEIAPELYRITAQQKGKNLENPLFRKYSL